MKRKPEVLARSGKSNITLKSVLRNFRDHGSQYEKKQLTQSVFLGVLRLKPVPSIFYSNCSSANNLIIGRKLARIRNNSFSKDTSKISSKKTEINKVICGRISKKNPQRIKASIKKIPAKINLRMSNRCDKTDSRALPETLSTKPVILNPVQFNPVENLFNKVKQKISGAHAFSTPDFAVERGLPNAHDPTDSGKKHRKNSKRKANDPDVIPIDKGSDEVILIQDESNAKPRGRNKTPERKTQNAEVIVIQDDAAAVETESLRVSPRTKKQESSSKRSSKENGDLIYISDEESNVGTSANNQDGVVVNDKTIDKPKSRRTRLLPTAIPDIFLNAPRLLRSELDPRKSIPIVKTKARAKLSPGKLLVRKPNNIKTYSKVNQGKKLGLGCLELLNDDQIVFVSEEIKSPNDGDKPSLKLVIRQQKKTDVLKEKVSSYEAGQNTGDPKQAENPVRQSQTDESPPRVLRSNVSVPEPELTNVPLILGENNNLSDKNDNRLVNDLDGIQSQIPDPPVKTTSNHDPQEIDPVSPKREQDEAEKTTRALRSETNRIELVEKIDIAEPVAEDNANVVIEVEHIEQESQISRQLPEESVNPSGSSQLPPENSGDETTRGPEQNCIEASTKNVETAKIVPIEIPKRRNRNRKIDKSSVQIRRSLRTTRSQETVGDTSTPALTEECLKVKVKSELEETEDLSKPKGKGQRKSKKLVQRETTPGDGVRRGRSKAIEPNGAQKPLEKPAKPKKVPVQRKSRSSVRKSVAELSSPKPKAILRRNTDNTKKTNPSKVIASDPKGKSLAERFRKRLRSPKKDENPPKKKVKITKTTKTAKPTKKDQVLKSQVGRPTKNKAAGKKTKKGPKKVISSKAKKALVKQKPQPVKPQKNAKKNTEVKKTAPQKKEAKIVKKENPTSVSNEPVVSPPSEKDSETQNAQKHMKKPGMKPNRILIETIIRTTLEHLEVQKQLMRKARKLKQRMQKPGQERDAKENCPVETDIKEETRVQLQNLPDEPTASLDCGEEAATTKDDGVTEVVAPQVVPHKPHITDVILTKQVKLKRRYTRRKKVSPSELSIVEPSTATNELGQDIIRISPFKRKRTADMEPEYNEMASIENFVKAMNQESPEGGFQKIGPVRSKSDIAFIESQIADKVSYNEYSEMPRYETLEEQARADLRVFDFNEHEPEAVFEPLRFRNICLKKDLDGENQDQGASEQPAPKKTGLKQATLFEMFDRVLQKNKRKITETAANKASSAEKIKPAQKLGVARSVFRETAEDPLREAGKRAEEMPNVKIKGVQKQQGSIVQSNFSEMLPPPTPAIKKASSSPEEEDPELFEDDDSRGEWMPEELAEYKFKYSAKKVMNYKPIYKCKICLSIFPTYYKLTKHKMQHSASRHPYACKQCDESFITVEELVAHIRIHKGKHPYVCQKCGEGFWSKKSIDAHTPVHVLRKAKELVKKYECDLCKKRFAKICDVERHTRVHTGEKPFVCNICNNRFQQAHNLSKHLLIHLHLKPFSCEICGKKFGRIDVLNRHVLTHSINKPIKCRLCPKDFIRQSQLTHHVQKEHTKSADGPAEESVAQEAAVEVQL